MFLCNVISQSCYSNQLLINKAYVSYGFLHLKRLWSVSVDFQIFCEFFSSTVSLKDGVVGDNVMRPVSRVLQVSVRSVTAKVLKIMNPDFKYLLCVQFVCKNIMMVPPIIVFLYNRDFFL